MVADDVVQEHLRLLSEYIEDLKSEQGISFQQYQDDKKTRRFVEHTIQIAIECCFDIGHRIIAERRLPLPKERREIFDVLSDEAIHRYLIAETSNRDNQQQPPENSSDRAIREPRARYSVRKRKRAKRHARK